ncbi:MAG: hypothetical protein LBD82_02965 [Deltaproteobacteria bacterium]|nr:hypothetical protein [Deltaproteobacteria bacterium]
MMNVNLKAELFNAIQKWRKANGLHGVQTCGSCRHADSREFPLLFCLLAQDEIKFHDRRFAPTDTMQICDRYESSLF